MESYPYDAVVVIVGADAAARQMCLRLSGQGARHLDDELTRFLRVGFEDAQFGLDDKEQGIEKHGMEMV